MKVNVRYGVGSPRHRRDWSPRRDTCQHRHNGIQRRRESSPTIDLRKRLNDWNERRRDWSQRLKDWSEGRCVRSPRRSQSPRRCRRERNDDDDSPPRRNQKPKTGRRFIRCRQPTKAQLEAYRSKIVKLKILRQGASKSM